MLVIGSYNKTPVNVHFLVVQTQWPLAIVMAMMLFSGFVFGLIGALIVGNGKSKQTVIKNKAPESNSPQLNEEQKLSPNPSSNNELIPAKEKS